MSGSCEISTNREYSNNLVNDDLPTAEAIKAAEAIELFDGEGKKHTFKSIYSRPDLPQRVLVVFVRHFFCCVGILFPRTRPTANSTVMPIIIVGHGDIKQVDMYRLDTGWQYPIYTDPSEKLYSTLGMIKTWKEGPPNKYMPWTSIRAVYWSIKTAIWRRMQGYPIFSSGSPDLQGGEFLFEGEGGDKKVTWCHRMRNSRDHTDSDEIADVLGLIKV
ncbi:6-hydroxy-d-nicotine oxidase [Fusarium longipes]|uniref:6-hydroxy-d-nicotine oxidase n=1 Tax=Fusarium longipes TaxID=694270 RepID=A0A395T984_9HYPO|nr:6-hydroxy-d-nicotine oxidase [Fusarium longipes]